MPCSQDIAPNSMADTQGRAYDHRAVRVAPHNTLCQARPSHPARLGTGPEATHAQDRLCTQAPTVKTPSMHPSHLLRRRSTTHTRARASCPPGPSWSWTRSEPTAATRRRRPQTAASMRCRAALAPQTPHLQHCCVRPPTAPPLGRASPRRLGRGWDAWCARGGQRAVRGCCRQRPGRSPSQSRAERLTREQVWASSPAACAELLAVRV